MEKLVKDRLGKYEIRSVLGRGAMGTVYEGWDPVISRRVAIKTVRLPDSDDSEEREQLGRFQQEAQAAGRLQHPNIVGVFDYAETGELAYIVMEFVDGRTLKSIVDGGTRPELMEVGRVMDGLLTGLAYSHGHGVIHRDIKPANIIVTPAGQVKIADFGIARIESSTMTQAGSIMGTPAYMSPEQFQGAAIDARTDIYSAGVVLFQLLTGKRPFEGSMATIMHAVLNNPAPRPSALDAGVPRSLDAIVLRAIARAPEDRYPDAAAFNRALQAAVLAPDAPVAGTVPEGLGDLLEDDPTVVMSATNPAGKKQRAVSGPVAATKPRASRLPWMLAGIAALVLLGGGTFWALSGHGRSGLGGIAATGDEGAAASNGSGTAGTGTAGNGTTGSGTTDTGTAGTGTAGTGTAGTGTAGTGTTGTGTAGTGTTGTGTTGTGTAGTGTAGTGTAGTGTTGTGTAGTGTAGTGTAGTGTMSTGTAGTGTAGTGTGTVGAGSGTGAGGSNGAGSGTSDAAASGTGVTGTGTSGGTDGVAFNAPSPEALRRAVAGALSSAPCSFATGDDLKAGSVLRGTTGARTGASALHGAVQDAAPGQTFDWRVTEVDDRYCAVLDVLRPYARPFGATGRTLLLGLADGRTELAKDELLRPRLVLPEGPSYLQLDYFSSDGTVMHLHDARPGPTYPTDAAAGFGDPRPPGFVGWGVDAPFGTDLVVAVASSAPLFRTGQVLPGTADGYLRDLRTVLAQVTRGGGRVSAFVLPVRTRPKS